jgi:2-dehydropantoate 2-reductase
MPQATQPGVEHAVVGTGAVGCYLAAHLAQDGNQVCLVTRGAVPAGASLRVDVLAGYDRAFGASVPLTERVPDTAAIAWLAVKAGGLAGFTQRNPGFVGVIVPLLNGIGHLPALRGHYRDAVVPGTIRVEANRVGTGRIEVASLFGAIEVAVPADRGRAVIETAVGQVRASGIGCAITGNDATVLWGKLAFYLPLALGTVVVDGRAGHVRRDDAVWALVRRSARELTRAGQREGADIDENAIIDVLDRIPARLTTSLQRDVAAGRPSEFDFLCRPVLELIGQHALPVTAFPELHDRAASAILKG